MTPPARMSATQCPTRKSSPVPPTSLALCEKLILCGTAHRLKWGPGKLPLQWHACLGTGYCRVQHVCVQATQMHGKHCGAVDGICRCCQQDCELLRGGNDTLLTCKSTSCITTLLGALHPPSRSSLAKIVVAMLSVSCVCNFRILEEIADHDELLTECFQTLCTCGYVN